MNEHQTLDTRATEYAGNHALSTIHSPPGLKYTRHPATEVLDTMHEAPRTLSSRKPDDDRR